MSVGHGVVVGLLVGTGVDGPGLLPPVICDQPVVLVPLVVLGPGQVGGHPVLPLALDLQQGENKK